MIFKEIPCAYSEQEIQDFSIQNNLHFKTAKILMQRGIDNAEKLQKFLSPTKNDLKDPFLLDGMEECHKKLQKAINERRRILIYGDYDVDGISAVAILYKFLKHKNADVSYFLPNRYEDGYGITINTCQKIIKEYSPELVVTVDCGITCVDEIEYLKNNGVDVIVTDHHEPLDVLPNTVVVDPKTKNNSYGFTGLCGAGVALKVVQSFVGINRLDEYLPICALATVSDIVPLKDENRTIVTLGLKQWKNLPKGIIKLVDELKIDEVTSQTISFKIAPRLNAGGRMGNAYTALDLLISDDEIILNNSLVKLLEQNAERQRLSQIIYDDCIGIIKKQKLYEQKAIFIKSANWDSGLLGIACARLVDDFYKPVFLFSEVDGVLKGSVRSIATINIHSMLATCSGNLQTFGGHSMAAGLSLDADKFEQFVAEAIGYLNKNTTSKDYLASRNYDVEITYADLNVNFAKQIELLEPFGCENPLPQYLINYKKCVVSKFANFDEHLNISLNNSTKFICFNSKDFADDFWYAENKQSIVELQVNRFRGKDYLKGIIKYTNFYGVTKQIQNLAQASTIRQLSYKDDSTVKINFCGKEQVSEILNQNLQFEQGTAIIINSFSTYQKYKTQLQNYQLSYFVGGSQSKFEENCVIFALENIQKIQNYKRLIFLDGLYSRGFLSEFSGEIFAVNNESFSLEKLNTERSYFGIVFKAIKEVLDKNLKYRSEFELYNLTKENGTTLRHMSYSQFIYVLYVFVELNIIKLSTQNYQISINNNIKTNLENSSFYNKIRLYQKIK